MSIFSACASTSNTPPKRWNYPPLCTPTQLNLLFNTSSIVPSYYWLVGVCLLAKLVVDQCHHVLMFSIFLHRSIWHPRQWDFVLPHALPRPPLPSNILSTNDCLQILVDCCFASPKGGHQKSETGKSLNFLCILFQCPKQGNQQWRQQA